MRQVEDWNTYFMGLAVKAESRSKDPRTNVGAVLVRDRRVIATGYNGFPYCIQDTPELWADKDDFVQHAEENLISDCADRGVVCRDATMYTSLYPCLRCFRLLLSSHIACVYYLDRADYTSSWIADARRGCERLSALSGVPLLPLHLPK